MFYAAQCQCQHLLLSASVFVPILGAGQWHLPGVLPLESPCHLYQAHSKQGNYFKFPCDSWSSDHASCSWVSALLPHWNPLSLSGATFKTSESVLCWYFNPLLFPSQWFWGRVFLCNLLHVFSLFFSLSFYLTLLFGGPGFLPSECPWFLSSPDLSTVPTFYEVVIFSAYRHAALFFQSSDLFLGC